MMGACDACGHVCHVTEAREGDVERLLALAKFDQDQIKRIIAAFRHNDLIVCEDT